MQLYVSRYTSKLWQLSPALQHEQRSFIGVEGLRQYIFKKFFQCAQDMLR